MVFCDVCMAFQYRIANRLHLPGWFGSKGNWDKLNVAIASYNWETCFDSTSVDEIAFRLTQPFLNLARQFIPNKVATIRPKDKPWYNNILRRMRRRRDRLFGKAKNLMSDTARENYRHARNKYFHSLKQAHGNHNDKQFNDTNCSDISGRKWWQIVTRFMGSTKSSTVPALRTALCVL